MRCITRFGKLKVKYDSEEAAKEAAEAMESKHHEPFNAYLCKQCNFFHIGRDNGHSEKEVKVSVEV